MRTFLSVLLAAFGAACGSSSGGDTDTGTAGTTTTGTTTTGTTLGTSTGEESTTSTGTPTTSGTTMAIDACDLVSVMPPASTGGEMGETTAGGCMDPPGQPNDSACTDLSGCGCSSGRCYYLALLGGVCGECMTDADCPSGGCTGPDPDAGQGAVCNDGGRGATCLSDAVCSDATAPHCAQLYLAQGILSVATCSECRSNADCGDPAADNCTPAYDVKALGGLYKCVADGSVPNGGGCNLSDCMGSPIGDRACASGFCGKGSVYGVIEMGICGECGNDADCPDGKTCMPGYAKKGTGEVLGATCV